MVSLGEKIMINHEIQFFSPQKIRQPISTCMYNKSIFWGPNVDASSCSQEVYDLKEQLKDAEATASQS